MECKTFISSEVKRLLDKQQALDPSSNEYYVVMKNLECLLQLEELYEAAINIIAEYYGVAADKDTSKVVEFPGVDTSHFEQTAEVAESSETKEYKLEEVRAALVDARRNKGVNVTELLKEFGVENFSAFPAGKYGELMARLEKV